MDRQGETVARDEAHQGGPGSALAWDADNSGREPIAIIDVGSNSVRLVVFEGLDRHPRVLFNEKVLCGLGRGVGEKGRLEEKAVARALATLRRFALLCREMGVQAIEAVATAAVREAENGEEFVSAVARETGIALGVLSGTREAELSAYGVISAFPHGQGVMGDLGGGSLELARIGSGAVVSQLSLPLGSLRLQGAFGGEIPPVRQATRAALAPHLDGNWPISSRARNRRAWRRSVACPRPGRWCCRRRRRFWASLSAGLAPAGWWFRPMDCARG